jgi:hypothetical protein
MTANQEPLKNNIILYYTQRSEKIRAKYFLFRHSFCQRPYAQRRFFRLTRLYHSTTLICLCLWCVYHMKKVQTEALASRKAAEMSKRATIARPGESANAHTSRGKRNATLDGRDTLTASCGSLYTKQKQLE